MCEDWLKLSLSCVYTTEAPVQLIANKCKHASLAMSSGIPVIVVEQQSSAQMCLSEEQRKGKGSLC